MSASGPGGLIPPGEVIIALYEVVPPFAHVAITRDVKTGRMLYRALEPVLTQTDEKVIGEIKRVLLEEQRPLYDELKKKSPEEVLRRRVESIIKKRK
ncbi:MAG: hypothetical protein QXS92_02195, partial [Thermofilum sp.]